MTHRAFLTDLLLMFLAFAVGCCAAFLADLVKQTFGLCTAFVVLLCKRSAIMLFWSLQVIVHGLYFLSVMRWRLHKKHGAIFVDVLCQLACYIIYMTGL